jgi:predicted DNA-binding transcriptional regulator AlpA
MREWRRLPGGALGGLLWRVLWRNHLAWLEKAIPEDFQQECHLFLLEWQKNGDSNNVPLPREKFQKFARTAARHFYRLAVSYGWRRPRASGYKRTRNIGWIEEFGQEDEIIWKDYDWIKKKIEFCRKVLLDSDNGFGKLDWYGFQAYLAGCNCNEIAFLTGWTPSLVREHLRIAIRRIREAAGVNPNLPFPPMPKRGKVEFRQGRDVGAGSQPNPGKGRHLVSPGLSVEEIMERYGVSRTTAFRARKRGWLAEKYCQPAERTISDPFGPYRVTLDKELTIKEIMTRFGISQRKAYRARKRGWVIDQEKIRSDPDAPKKVKQWLRLVESQRGGRK